MIETHGGTFDGGGGLALAVERVFGCRTVWHCENDPAASLVLAWNWPDVVNWSDINSMTPGEAPLVDVISGGFPCQDVSVAGRRAGLRPDTRSGLWAKMHAVITDQTERALAEGKAPPLVVIENVGALTSAEAHSDVERCPDCLGDGSTPSLRALGAVLGDLARLGFHAEWGVQSAASVGAAHQRKRVFIVAAHPERLRRERWGDPGDVAGALAPQRDEGPGRDPRGDAAGDRGTAAPDGDRLGLEGLEAGDGADRRVGVEPRHDAARRSGEAVAADPAAVLAAAGRAAPADDDGLGLEDEDDRRDEGDPPAVGGLDAGGGADAAPDPGRRSREARRRPTGGRAQGRRPLGGAGGRPVDPRATADPDHEGLEGPQPARRRDVPTGGAPADPEGDRRGEGRPESGGLLGGPDAPVGDPSRPFDWGIYAGAIARAERVWGRPHPYPTVPNRKGAPRLNPRFVEWHMGWPAGHVTDVPDVPDKEMLRILGNGVVPLAAAWGIAQLYARLLADVPEPEHAA